MHAQQTEKLIDVVEDFQCPQQSAAYHAAFRKWRRNEKNRYAFRCTFNPKEASFSESKAVISETPSNIEQGALYRVGYLIGCLLVLYLVIENVLDKIIVFLMNAMGMHVDMMFWGSELYGDERNVFLVIFLINTMKYLFPALLMILFLRLPWRVSIPGRITQVQELLFGVALTMLLSAGVGMFLVTSSGELEKYKLICNAVEMDDSRMFLYMLFTIFALPIMTEFLLHGAMFQVLRQFGDGFAIAAVSILAACMMHNIQDALRVAIMTLTISCFVIRTGSFWTAVILHIVHEIYMFALFYIETFDSVYSLQWWMTILLPCAVGIAAAVYMILHKPDQEEKNRNQTFLKIPDKFLAFFSSVPMLGLLITCVVMTIVSLMISA